MLVIGVPYDVFWYEDFDMIDSYMKAYKTKMDLVNQESWLKGVYTYDAVSIALSNLFKKKNAPVIPYHEKPMEIFTEKKKQKLSDAEIAYNRFKPVIEHFNSRRKKK